MPIAPGSRLGGYEILSSLGAGGMGEVYRARDPKLQRDVAVKVLSDALARDTESLARFEREARLLASVDHPNIAVIHAIETEYERPFLVLELIPGETLAERLAAGPLPVPEALQIAGRIADALSAAHERGVIHRDLKPGNIRLTPDGRVKVLDFGLARVLADASTADSATVTGAMAADATAPGSILGTPAYMSPEQARGRPVDRRTDLWSFGCVLFEMLTGRKAFEGESASDCLVAILTRDPDWTALPSATPPPVRDLLRRCLEKDANRRMRDAGDAKLELEPAPGEASESRAAAGRGTRLAGRGLARLLRPILSALAPANAAGETTPARPHPKISQLTVAEGIEGFPAWSPDGERLAFVREVGPTRRIFVRDIATGAETPITRGAWDEIQPEWAPDGAIVFTRGREHGRRLEPRDVFGQYDGADIWRIEPATGREMRLAENAANPTFAPGGQRIAVDASWAGPRRIWTLDPRGRNPEQATTDVSEAVAHVRPRWSPDGRRIAFQNIERTKFDVRVVDLETKKLVWVTNDHFQDIGPAWSPSGRFLYFSSYRSGGLNVWRIAVAADGSPSGLLEQLTTGPGQDVDVAISPDGRRLALAILNQNASLWRLPLDPATGRVKGAPEKLVASTREDSRGGWSMDSRRVAFNSDRAGQMNIWLFEGSDGSTRQLTRGSGGDFQPRFSPDGRSLAFFSSRSGSADIWSLEIETATLRRLTRGPSIDVNPFFSPDGARIAYMSDQGGRLEVWVMDADGGHPRALTETGVMGHFLAWTPSGDAIVYRNPSGKPASFRVSVEGGDPEPLPEVVGGAHMSLSPDGSRIIDVLAHKTLWVSPLSGGSPEKVFEFDDPDVRIDYPVWSPDGRWLLFDRFRPQGGNVWMMERFE